MSSPPVIGAPYLPGPSELRPFAAEVWLTLGVVANLLVPFVRKRPNAACAAASLLAIGFAIASVAFAGGAAGPQFRGLLVADFVGVYWKLVLLAFTAGVVLLWWGTGRLQTREGDAAEFFVLLLGATIGMCLMGSTTHLLMVVLAVALASLPSYALAGFRRGSKRGSEAALKYVLFGAVTAAVLAYGVSFAYGWFGSLRLDDWAATPGGRGGGGAVAVAVVGLLVGLGFKVSAVPVHPWCPDVFEGAPIEVTTFLSVASKGAGLVLLLRVVELATPAAAYLPATVGAIGAVTMTVGNTAAFTQANVKRLLAYSSIAQAGYMLCAVAAGGDAGRRAVLIYLAVYAVANLGAFAVAAVVFDRTGGESVDDFRGLGRSSPGLAAALLACLVSLIGLPPTAGFWAKLNVLAALFDGDGPWRRGLVGVVVVNTVLSAVYYFRLVRAMYLQPADGRWSTEAKGGWVAATVGGLCGVGVAVLFVAYGPLYASTAAAAVLPAGTVAR